MNECHFLGNLTRDPELKIVGDNKQVVNFGIAVNRKFKRGNEMTNEPSFLDCEAWDSGAELIEKHFHKGDPIIIHCSVKQDNWEDPDGKKRSKLKFRVNKFDFVPGRKNGNGEKAEGEQEGPPSGTATAKPAPAKKSSAKKASPAAAEPEPDGDIPF